MSTVMCESVREGRDRITSAGSALFTVVNTIGQPVMSFSDFTMASEYAAGKGLSVTVFLP